MDKLTKQLKADAAMIDVQVSDELDRRITASLHGVTPERPEPPAVQSRPAAFWWASSLTGVASPEKTLCRKWQVHLLFRR